MCSEQVAQNRSAAGTLTPAKTNRKGLKARRRLIERLGKINGKPTSIVDALETDRNATSEVPKQASRQTSPAASVGAGGDQAFVREEEACPDLDKWQQE